MQQNNSLYKFLLFFFLLLIIVKTKGQTGLNFQGVARSSNNVILASQQISLRLSILQGSATGNVEYSEIRKISTNAQGLFSLVIGDIDANSTIGNFSTINWKNTPKFLKIEMDPNAGDNFILIGITQFQYVAYAQFANSVNADNITGVIPVVKGGTGVTSLNSLKTALAIDKSTIGLSNVDNTADSSKPISKSTQLALDVKANNTDLILRLKIADTSAMLSNRIGKDTLNLSSRINLKANTIELTNGLSTKVDKITGKDLSSNDFTTAEKTKLAAITGINTGDQDLSSYATNTALALKENIANKSTATDLGGASPSDILFPTQKAVKEYITANSASGNIADAGITTNKIADAAVSYIKIQNIAANSILGNTTNSSASVKAIPTTGTDQVVLSTNPTINSPSLITPNLGVATATTINNVSITGFNFKSNTPSLTITGTTTLVGDNTGDNAINNRYESLVTNGVVDIVSAQNIVGEKYFSSNLTMSNNVGVGTNTPTTINFANGSQVGDIQHLMEYKSPDIHGSIDLFAPWGAEWVQMNYGNTNYIWLDQGGSYIDVAGSHWDFLFDGLTKLPRDISIGNDLNKSDTAKISTMANLSFEVNSIQNNGDKYNWYMKNNGNTELPGNLNFTDNHAINFISTGNSTPTASIYAAGPYMKLKTRAATAKEINDEEIDWGINIDYGNKNGLTLNDGQNVMYINSNDSLAPSLLTLDPQKVSFSLAESKWSQKNWFFDGKDGSTILPGSLTVNGSLNINPNSIAISSIDFSSLSGNTGDILTLDGDGSVYWSTKNLTNSITGTSSGSYTRTSGLIPFFYGSENTITGSTNLYWDASNNKENKLTVGTSNSGASIVINQGNSVYNDIIYGLKIVSPPEINPDGQNHKYYGSQIGFSSNDNGDPLNPNINTGLFQLDAAGNMVFRTLQSDLYFDNFGNGTTIFRVGSEASNINGMTLNNSGNLEVHASVSASNFITTSDQRLKKNIVPLKNSLLLIKKMNPVSYEKKKKIVDNIYDVKENGFIAQELQKILPNLIHTSDDKDKLLSINYTGIIPILTKGIQEQQDEIEGLKKEIAELKRMINKIIKPK